MTFARLLVSAFLLAAPAGAAVQTSPAISAAKEAGVVGERYDGYLGFTGSPSRDVQRQVGAVNIKRRSLYTALAARRNATVQEVGIAAGCELLGQIKVGEIYMLNDGEWRSRGSGQPAPLPSYCRR